MDSLKWSKKYEVLSISRLDLLSWGLSHEQVTCLTDEDLQKLADIIADHYYTKAFLTTVMCTVLTILAVKEEECIPKND
jgi:hypothetical protein